MNRRLSPCLGLLVLASGCATIHTRATTKFEDGRRGYTVAMMVPDLNVQWEYIGTNKFFRQRGLEKKSRTRVGDELLDEFKDRGYKIKRLRKLLPPEEEDADATEDAGVPPSEDDSEDDAEAGPPPEDPAHAAARARLDGFRAEMQGLSDRIISQDPAYLLDKLGKHYVRELPDLSSLVEGEKVNADYLLYVWGDVRLETTRGTIWRMLKTMVLGMAKGTVADIGNAMLGGTLGSPEEVWVRAALLDARTGQLVYHSDYFKRNWTLFQSSMWEDIAEGLMEDVPDR